MTTELDERLAQYLGIADYSSLPGSCNSASSKIHIPTSSLKGFSLQYRWMVYEENAREMRSASPEMIDKLVWPTSEYAENALAEQLSSAIGDCNAGFVSKAMDTIFREFDKRFRAKDFLECDKLLRDVDVSEIPIQLLVGVLSITLAASPKLYNRPRFFTEAQKWIKLRGQDPKRLIGGLRGGRAVDGKSLLSKAKAC